MRDKIAELKEMVRDGIITSDIAEQAIAKIQEKVIMEKGITMPTITAIYLYDAGEFIKRRKTPPNHRFNGGGV